MLPVGGSGMSGGNEDSIQHAADSISKCVHSHYLRCPRRVEASNGTVFSTGTRDSVVARCCIRGSWCSLVDSWPIPHVRNRASDTYSTIRRYFCAHRIGSSLSIVGKCRVAHVAMTPLPEFLGLD